MKKILQRTCVITTALLITLAAAALLFASCVEPSPFYGTWADNMGNRFTFVADNTFSAQVKSSGVTINYEGNYTVLMNVLTLDCTNVTLRVVTEWDIRGNIMYIKWTSLDGISMSLQLYKVSN